ncbi:hypothetical protein A4U49_11945 [Acidithiobacillus ferrivorans]|nr:hypothetical protein A4U49_11945 [Acidithiobacillus ferrivorans]
MEHAKPSATDRARTHRDQALLTAFATALPHALPLPTHRKWLCLHIGVSSIPKAFMTAFFKRHGPVAVMLGRFIIPLWQLQGNSGPIASNLPENAIQ